MQFSFLNGFLMDKVVSAIGWTLLHSLWVGLLLSTVTAFTLFVGKRLSSATRYNIAALFITLFVALCTILFGLELIGSSGTETSPLLRGSSELFIHDPRLQDMYARFTRFFTNNALFIVVGWLAIMIVKLMRMMSSQRYIGQIRKHKVSIVDKGWQRKIDQFANRLGINRAISLLESEIVRMPVIIGHLKPIILMPIGLLSNLPPAQLEAVLLHELAHIRRNDFLVNYIQTILEAVFFFNPGLLWLSAVMREERENCCDDMALQQTNDKHQYVQALIRFKEYSLAAPRAAMAFPGKKNQLLQRVTRILSGQNGVFHSVEKGFFIASLVVLLIVTAFFVGKREGKKLDGEMMTEHLVDTEESAIVENTIAGSKLISTESEPLEAARANEQRQVDENIVEENEHVVEERRINSSESLPAEEARFLEHAASEKESARLEVEQEWSKHNTEIAVRRAKLDRIHAEEARRRTDKERIHAQNEQKQAELDRAQAVKEREIAREAVKVMDAHRASIANEKH
jgi:beta-lactamase regulating signal transducer with metallopeptidase domain